jgi:hypothetical protein
MSLQYFVKAERARSAGAAFFGAGQFGVIIIGFLRAARGPRAA